ncbi:hypothetical protein [Bradyrhizobium erythrophlei]|uniref:CobQ/CobB/MinD/ParA nucleotide binding domain-containing protein n=1 Tax=Bradyrhizobium erythrophlei TaxID=1437360 RepID=A0A1M5NT82_9BRAD|nr:hypothetical protein [Bradyrhizobium erythrophlei]SHG92645.1 hypothetical protein SAMN05443248_3104 [Bradyrhizobium erythrophlei]
MVPHVVIIGADKGGVGKTTVSRTFMDYFQSHGISVRARDTEYPQGVLQRFHPDKTKIVNLEESDDQVEVFDNLRDAQVTLIDIRAGLLSKTLATLSEIGFLAGAKDGRLRISVVHVIGSNKASFDEIEATASAVEGAKHYVLLNHMNKSKFMGLPASVRDPIIVPMLNELAADTVDRLGIGFDAYCSGIGLEAGQTPSSVLAGYIRAWKTRVFAEYDRRALNAL